MGIGRRRKLTRGQRVIFENALATVLSANSRTVEIRTVFGFTKKVRRRDLELAD